MGNNRIITPEQELILSLVRGNEYLTKTFYFTGGTALALYYLNHRESVDLDFFNNKSIDQAVITAILQDWKNECHFELTTEFIEVVLRSTLRFPSGQRLLLDFAYYPCNRIEKGHIFDALEVDSLTDIAVNKLKCVIDRTDVKDFVDLYYLLTEKKFSVYDLIEGVKVKFGYKVDPYILASDFYKMQEFDILPKMFRPLTLDELKTYFRQKAQELGKKAIE